MQTVYTSNLSVIDIAYLAGIIDGEGCISFGMRQKKYITPTLQITNTDMKLIEWLVEKCGGNFYERKDERTNRKQSWLWSVAGQRARFIIELVRPYLIIKTEQADLILRVHGLYQRRQIITDVEIQANKDAIAKIRELNKRGR